jgi:hypothetical protein
MQITIHGDDTATVIPVGIKVNGNCAHKDTDIVEGVTNFYDYRRGEMDQRTDQYMECLYCGDTIALEDDEDYEYYED